MRPAPDPSRQRLLRHASRAGVVETLEGRRMLSSVRPSARQAVSDAVGDVILPPRQVERLDRGVVAVRTGASTAYVGWRLLVDDAAGVSFNLYRVTGTGAPVKRNTSPITASTNFADTGVSFTTANQYFVRPVLNGVEGAESRRVTLEANAPTRQYLNVPLQVPPPGLPLPATANTVAHTPTYTANDTSVGDLDGDGQYELIVKWEPDDAKDNSQDGYTGNVLLDAYKLDGTRLWRIDLGRNIRAGAHYTQFQVYDFDGDGKAEIACKTAPGTVDGLGQNVLMGSDNAAADYRNSAGYILSGPEYLTMFNGLTGAAASTVAYDPPRGITTNNPTSTQLNSIWGDNYGNRVDRFLSATAYLDGQRPSLIMSRGYYTRAVLAAYDYRNGQLVQRWKFDSDDGTGQTAYRGQGAHSLSVADVDNDGRDEIIYGAATINDNGRGLYSTTLGHGDATHVSDFIPDRPGQEVFMIHEDQGSYSKNGINAGMEVHDARTGELLLTVPGEGDIGRGVAFDIDPRYAGTEYWGTADGNIYNYAGKSITNPDGTTSNTKAVATQASNMFRNFAIQWDADPLYEIMDGTTISDWRIDANGNGGRFNYVSFSNHPVPLSANNGSKATPALAADLFGDWRDEVIWRTSDNTALQIWTTTIPTTTRQFTAMQDIQYREAIAWQNVGYNQPAHPSFFQGNGMTPPPIPSVFFAGSPSPEAPLLDNYQAETAALSGAAAIESTNGGFEGSGYVNYGATAAGAIQWSNLPSGGGASTIRLRFALGGTASRTGRLLINGVATNVTFLPTGSFNAWQTMSIATDIAANTPITVRLETTGADLPNIDSLQVRRVPDIGAPTASSMTFDFTKPLKTIAVEFSENVGASLTAADLVITNTAVAGQTFTATAVAFNSATNVATFLLPTLTDGDYRATIARTNVTDTSGNALAADATTTFFILAGDINRDRTVNFADLVILAQNYNSSGRTYGTGDLTGDGTVNFADLVVLAQNYNTSLPAASTMVAPAGLFEKKRRI